MPQNFSRSFGTCLRTRSNSRLKPETSQSPQTIHQKPFSMLVCATPASAWNRKLCNAFSIHSSRGNRSFEHRVGGLGLGLAISKSLAQAHGGTLTAQSGGHDCGSTFIFSMPTLSPTEVAIVPPKISSEASQHGLKILLVDDHQDTCAA